MTQIPCKGQYSIQEREKFTLQRISNHCLVFTIISQWIALAGEFDDGRQSELHTEPQSVQQEGQLAALSFTLYGSRVEGCGGSLRRCLSKRTL